MRLELKAQVQEIDNKQDLQLSVKEPRGFGVYHLLRSFLC